MRTPRELIELYWERVYNNGEADLIREICADPIIRHDANFVTALSHEDQIIRVNRSLKTKPLFTHRVLVADDRYVTSVWNMVSRDGRDINLCGIEVFEAEDGRFTRCWNSTYMQGFWGEDDDEFDPATLTSPQLVDSPEQISADWLQRVLAAGGVVTPQRLAMEPAVSLVGHGTTSTVAKVHASYNSGKLSAPTDMICKIGCRTPEQVFPGPFERERLTYELFGPEPAFGVPRMYFGETDDQGRTNLLLEDISALGWVADQLEGCSVAEASAVVRELASFHLAFWEDQEVLSLDWLSQRDRLLPAYAKGAVILADWLGDRVSQDDLAMVREFAELAPDWLAIEPAHRSLNHSDPRADNILLEETDQGLRACLIDWQGTARGDPLYDVAYFLSGSVVPDVRRDCERDLVAEYTEIVRSKVTDLALEGALESYRSNISSGLWMTVIAAAFAERSDHNAKLIATLLERNAIAIRDWDAFAAFG